MFWRTLAHLHRCEPTFGGKRKSHRLLHRFRVKVHAVDSTVIAAAGFLILRLSPVRLDGMGRPPSFGVPVPHPSFP